MTTNLPSHYASGFTNERLTIVAKALLEQCYETDDDLKSRHDKGYNIGCVRFGRQRSSLLEMELEHDWLSVIDSSNKITMAINGVPFRFTTDDYLKPKKKKILEISERELEQICCGGGDSSQISLDLNDPNIDVNFPIKWRFYIDVSYNIEDGSRDYEILFIGQNIVNEACCIWKLSEHKSPYIRSTDDTKPEPVKMQKPKTTLPTNLPDKQSEKKDDIK